MDKQTRENEFFKWIKSYCFQNPPNESFNLMKDTWNECCPIVERLAKIEVLKSFWNRAVEEHLDCSDVKDLIDRMRNELKWGN